MANGRFISYLRVSTKGQGDSGLGLEAQRRAVASYLNGGNWKLVKEFVEIESGKRSDRPALAKALEMCELCGATLVVAKLDRLARNTHFLLTVKEKCGKAGIVFCDLPNIQDGPQGKFMVTQMAAVAEFEGAAISARTKAALAASTKVLGGRRVSAREWTRIADKGRQLGTEVRSRQASEWAHKVLPIIHDIKQDGAATLRDIAEGLNDRGIQTSRGGQWTATQVLRVQRMVSAA